MDLLNDFPGEKDRVNARLARALVGTTRLYADVYTGIIIIVLRAVTPKRVGTNGSKFNDVSVSTLTLPVTENS